VVVKPDTKFLKGNPPHCREKLNVNCGIVGCFWKLLESFTDSLFNKFVWICSYEVNRITQRNRMRRSKQSLKSNG